MTSTIYQDPLDRFKPSQSKSDANRPVPPELTKPVEQPNIANDPLGKFGVEQFAPESTPEFAARRTAQLASSGAERAGGLVGDIKNSIKDLVLGSYENATLSSGDYDINKVGKGTKQREAPDWLRNMFESKPAVGFDAPSSPELREASEKATGGYTKPRNEEEEFTRNLFGDITASLLPGGPNRSITNNLLIPTGANIIKKGVEKFTGDDRKATIAQTGAYFLLGLMGNANANRFAGEMRQRAIQEYGNTTVNPGQLSRRVNTAGQRFLSGTKGTNAARAHVQGIMNDMNNGRTRASQLIERVSEINDDIANGGGFDAPVTATRRNRSVAHLNEIKTAAQEALQQASQNNPNAWYTYQQSNNAWSAILQSNRVIDWASKHYGKIASAGLATMLGLGHAGQQYLTAKGALGGAGVVAGGLAFHKAGQVLYRISQSPELRRYYADVVGATAANNIPQFAAAFSKLDHKLAEEEKKTAKLQKPEKE